MFKSIFRPSFAENFIWLTFGGLKYFLFPYKRMLIDACQICEAFDGHLPKKLILESNITRLN